jgi:hypothetical protein
MEFKIGDSVKFFMGKYSIIPVYGEIVKVNKNTCKVRVHGEDHEVYVVKKSELNFD